MVRRRTSRVLRSIKQRVQAGQYRLTDHALVEMDDEAITDADVVSALVQGELQAVQTHDPRGRKYLIRGPGTDGKLVEAVCRPVGSNVRIITVYRVE